MNVSLTPKLEQFVRDQAETGQYNNASEVIREAIRLLQQREEEREIKLEALRAALDEGEAAIKAGNFTRISSPGELDAFFDSL